LTNPFEATFAEPLSFAVTPIELVFEGKEIAHATGFLWRHESRLVLVTNWHNFAGKHTFTGGFLNNGGAIPDTARIYPEWRVQRGEMVDLIRQKREIRLYEHFDLPLWKQHAQFAATRADIVTIDAGPDDPAIFTANAHQFENLYTGVGSTLFVVGYPFRDYNTNGHRPIWKSGTLASDPNFDWNGHPAFLIDSATRPGMSGSPIFRRVFGPAALVRGEGKLETKLDAVVTTQFVGIYSGHLTSGHEAITIGIGWPAHLFEELLRHPAPGTRD
jgi:hypothetical protein